MIDEISEDRYWSRLTLFSGGVAVLAAVVVVISLGSSSGQMSGGQTAAEQSLRLGFLIILIMAPVAFYLTAGVWAATLTLGLRLFDITTNAKRNVGIMAVAELGKLIAVSLLAFTRYRNTLDGIVGPNGEVALSRFGPKPGALSWDLLVWGGITLLVLLKMRAIKPAAAIMASLLIVAARWSTTQLLLAFT